MMEKISWADRVKTKREGEEECPTYCTMKEGQLDWTHILRSNCLLTHVSEGNTGGTKGRERRLP
jgi:hypothetical protein